jgi:hypothetical protein
MFSDRGLGHHRLLLDKPTTRPSDRRHQSEANGCESRLGWFLLACALPAYANNAPALDRLLGNDAASPRWSHAPPALRE